MGWVAADVVTSAALTAGGVLAAEALPHDKTVAVTLAGAIACTTAVAYRRLAPATAALIALAAVAVYQISGHDTEGAFVSISVVLACYTVGRSGPWLRRLAVAAFALVATTAVQADSAFSLGDDLLTWGPLCVLPILAGVSVARRADMVRELIDKKGRLQDEQAIVQAGAVANERSRVARELHDVVAHSVSVMVIQAGAARLHVRTDLAAAGSALRVVVACGREALDDLLRVAGRQRRAGDPSGIASPGIAQLPELVARACDAGTAVRLHLDGHTNVPADQDLAVFRIVAESLTNVRKHAPTATVDVRVNLTADWVDITVLDSGPKQPSAVPGTGNGLIGMRERVALYGGDFDAGPTPSGGFVVRARLPKVNGSETAPATPTAQPAGAARWRPTDVQVDALFALVWLVPAEIEATTSAHRTGPLAWNIAAVALMALAVLVRRRMPLVFLVTIGVLAAALSGGITAPQRASVVGTSALVVGAYTVGAYCSRRRALVGLAGIVAAVVGMTVVRHAAAGVAAGGVLVAGVVWLGGRIARDQRALLGALRSVTNRLSAEHVQRTQIAVHVERMRIARDLQTIVAHLVTTMVTQGEAAVELLAGDETAAVDAIAAVEQTGRDALNHLRLMLGVLRSEVDPAPRHPHRAVSADGTGRALAAARLS